MLFFRVFIARGSEVDQTRPELEGVLNDGNVMHMRYKLPNIACDHAILMMRYREYAFFTAVYNVVHEQELEQEQ